MYDKIRHRLDKRKENRSITAMPSEEDVQKMCEEGGENLVCFLMGMARPSQLRTLKLRMSTTGPTRTLLAYPRLSRNSGDLLSKKSLMCCISTKSLSSLTVPKTGRSLRIDESSM